MNEDFDWGWYIQNLWQRENAGGLKAKEGVGGYKNGRYFPYKTPNGNIDVGPGFDLDMQTPEFVKKAYSEGYTCDKGQSPVTLKKLCAIID